MKNEMRRFFLNLRREMGKERIEEYSDKIYENLIKTDLYENASTIFVYVSMDKEINTERIIRKAQEDGKEIYVPFIEEKEMKAKKLEKYEDLVEGEFKIKTTSSDISIENPDLTLVPGLTFDKNKNRIGYGGGYYDKFLAKTETTSLGLFASPFESIEIPTDENDVALDYILTEEGLF
ncbi:MAG: 5-formyltetrahydrofolate cyclo-ligase [Anaerococcus prevotii]|uniref:5-formyltetrahydrofolate cyclo-ligase n=1 Tax=Anaerococcus prevotii TaxID=33034 RepID=UPI0029048142|nr:5-formyltetrahydrofolate cyclo-ligase [Anaerococcus prevotii]MDU2558907.1 5-formyltetrahydrofolate cyclo-ligase [Anaerococcus prevotii]